MSLEKIGLISNSEIPTCKVSVEQAEMFLAHHPHSAEKSAVTLIESFDANDEYGNLVSSCNEYGNEFGDLVSTCFIIFIS